MRRLWLALTNSACSCLRFCLRRGSPSRSRISRRTSRRLIRICLGTRLRTIIWSSAAKTSGGQREPAMQPQARAEHRLGEARSRRRRWRRPRRARAAATSQAIADVEADLERRSCTVSISIRIEKSRLSPLAGLSRVKSGLSGCGAEHDRRSGRSRAAARSRTSATARRTSGRGDHAEHMAGRARSVRSDRRAPTAR